MAMHKRVDNDAVIREDTAGHSGGKHDLFNTPDFLQTMFNAVPSYVFIVDSDVRIHHLNAAARKLALSGTEPVILKRGGEVLHCIHSIETPEGCGHSPSCSDCVIRNSVTEAFRNDSVYRKTSKMILYDGDRRQDAYFAVTASPFDYRNARFVVLVLEDITKEKTLENELLAKTAQLEAAYQEMETFSYSASHDLRAPLRQIVGFSDLLLSRYDKVLDGRGRGFLMRIRQASRHMSAIIDGLLQLSRITRAPLKRTTVDLTFLARDIARELSASEPGRRIDVTIQEGMSASGDTDLLRVLLENLLRNSWKYTGGKEKAEIEFGKTEKDREMAYFVRDNGAGFDMKYAGKLFVPFERLHTTDEFPGAGIGLATVKRIVKGHGGRIWAEGKLNEGAVFYFKLP